MLHSWWEEQALGYLHPAGHRAQGSGHQEAEGLGLKPELSFPSGCPASGSLLRVVLVLLSWAAPDNDPSRAGISSQEEKAPVAPEQVALLELPRPALH